MCEWCIAVKRSRRQRIRTQMLDSTLSTAPLGPQGVRNGWTVGSRYCDSCGRVISVRRDGTFFRHTSAPHTPCKGRPVPTTEDIEAAHREATLMDIAMEGEEIIKAHEFQAWLHSML